MVKVCLLGYGGIGHVHANGYSLLEKEGKAKLLGVCDINPDVFTKEIAINISDDSGDKQLSFNTYTDLDEMLAKEQPDMVDICLPTFLHKEKAVYLLNKGYHVFCEKPMALTYAETQEMLAAAKANGKELMIGQCLHFFSEYEYLKDLVVNGTYGKAISAFFQRLSPPPVWAWENWYMNSNLSGGCIQDLHIHDIDMCRYLFGNPHTVSCKTKDGFGKWDCAHSTLIFDDLHATVIGDWSLQNAPFEPSYRVAFEKATVICVNGVVKVYPAEGEGFTADIQPKDGYAAEVSYFMDVIGGAENTKNRADSASLSVKLIETLRNSANQGGKQLPFEV
ncbi:MAG: Gfo/Idh/MocA family oxidoreductase [Clostridia bacterium]|nr:Gfo/Idh/MocA family oxidoreductase [Clostridia bacterium]